MNKLFLILILICSSSLKSQSVWTWQQPLPTGNFLYAVDFINENTGFACGTVGTFMKTTNAGQNWIVRTTNFSSILLGINFIDEDLGFVVGGINGSILRTANSGLNWTTVFSGATTFMWSVDFPVRSTGYSVGLNGVILKSTNSGLYII